MPHERLYSAVGPEPFVARCGCVHRGDPAGYRVWSNLTRRRDFDVTLIRRPQSLAGHFGYHAEPCDRRDPRLCGRATIPRQLGVAYYLAGQHILFREQMARGDPSGIPPILAPTTIWAVTTIRTWTTPGRPSDGCGLRWSEMKPMRSPVLILAIAWRDSARPRKLKPPTTLR